MSREARTATYPAPPTAPLRVPPIPGWRDDPASLAQVFVSDEASGLTPGERRAAALRVAMLNGNQTLADTYRPPAAGDGEPSRRLAEILRYVERFAGDARAIRCADIRALEAAGLSIADVTALTRVVAFVTYQARLLAALDLIEPGA
ncbi:MAG: hypothetical protein WDM94_04525 [Bauldia sp.]